MPHSQPSPALVTSTPGTGTHLYVWSVQVPLREPLRTEHIASSTQKCMHKGKITPKNKVNPNHPRERGLPRCPGELAAGLPLPLAETQQLCETPSADRGRTGRKPEGCQFIYSPAGEQGYLKKLSEFLPYLLTPLRLGIASFLPLRRCSKVPCSTIVMPAKLWALPPACFHQQCPTSTGRKACDKLMHVRCPAACACQPAGRATGL